MSDLIWPFRLSCWRVICSVSPFFYPHLCELLSRERTHVWPINSDEKKTFQCGHVHSVALISEDVIHGTKSTFALSCWLGERGDGRKHLAEIVFLDSVAFIFSKLFQKQRVFWMVTSLSCPNTMRSSSSVGQLEGFSAAQAAIIPLSSSLRSMLSAREIKKRSRNALALFWSPSLG